MEPDPEKRITAEEALQHDYFKETSRMRKSEVINGHTLAELNVRNRL